MNKLQKISSFLIRTLGIGIGLLCMIFGLITIGTLIMILGLALPNIIYQQQNVVEENFNVMYSKVKCPKNITIEEIYKLASNIKTGFGKPWIAEDVGNLKRNAIIFGIVNNTYIYLYKTKDNRYIKILQSDNPSLIKPFPQDTFRLKDDSLNPISENQYSSSNININIPNTINYMTQQLQVDIQKIRE